MKILTWLMFTCLVAQSEVDKVFVGTFSKIEWGDYNHIVLIDKAGKNVSFWCGMMQGQALNCNEIESHSNKYAGKKMKITYKTIKSYVPEAKENITKQETTKIELLK
ncbi:MAG: hypothetical protein AB7F59_04365 [Bdellovibrionales bacterium]